MQSFTGSHQALQLLSCERVPQLRQFCILICHQPQGRVHDRPIFSSRILGY